MLYKPLQYCCAVIYHIYEWNVCTKIQFATVETNKITCAVLHIHFEQSSCIVCRKIRKRRRNIYSCYICLQRCTLMITFRSKYFNFVYKYDWCSVFFQLFYFIRCTSYQTKIKSEKERNKISTTPSTFRSGWKKRKKKQFVYIALSSYKKISFLIKFYRVGCFVFILLKLYLQINSWSFRMNNCTMSGTCGLLLLCFILFLFLFLESITYILLHLRLNEILQCSVE